MDASIVFFIANLLSEKEDISLCFLIESDNFCTILIYSASFCDLFKNHFNYIAFNIDVKVVFSVARLLPKRKFIELNKQFPSAFLKDYSTLADIIRHDSTLSVVIRQQQKQLHLYCF